jgi:16S rRNA (cytidine1402-2'-O)-methyltransferase
VQTGILYVVATPIGHLGDLTQRARDTLAAVDVVAAEDTRTTGRLLAHLGLQRPLLSVFAGNEHRRVAAVVGHLLAGRSVALVSECGTPGISDPGATLVAACVAAGATVVPVPGPSAVAAVLSASGFGADRFRFEGFLPRKGAERRRRIDALRREEVPCVLYESPHRIAATLRDLADALGPRPAVLAREVTKLHEELLRGTLVDLAARLDGQPVKGEVTLVVSGAPQIPDAPLAPDDVSQLLTERLTRGISPRDAAREVAAVTGLPRKDVYALAVRLKDRP